MKAPFNPAAKPIALQAQAKVQQGWTLQQAGQPAQALALYEQALQLQPRQFDALHLSGVIALQSGDPERAVDFFSRALKVERDNAMAQHNRGAAYLELGNLDFALLNCNKAIATEPGFAVAYNTRGNIHFKLNQHQAALADFDQAIALKPDYVEAHNNRGNALSGLQRHEEAAASFLRSTELSPQFAQAHWGLGMCRLRMGDFKQGWPSHEWRLDLWRASGWDRQYPGVRWTGAEPLAGRSILLHSEQGLGDTLQFCRYAELVHGLGAARVVLAVQAPLVALLAHLSHTEIIAENGPLPDCDFHCPLLSLPGAFGTDASNVPAVPDVIRPDAALVARWQALLGPATKPRVGIVWSGNAAHVDDGKRSIALKDFTAILSDDIQWVSLQKDVRASDQPTLSAHPEILQVKDDALTGFSGTASLCTLLDLVISVDTSIAHLAATLGKPVWLLLPHTADWRWLTERRDTPWYPTMTLYRQAAAGDWSGVFDAVKADLHGLPARPI